MRAGGQRLGVGRAGGFEQQVACLADAAPDDDDRRVEHDGEVGDALPQPAADAGEQPDRGGVVRAGGLVYLGSLLPDRDVPASIPDLDRQLAGVGRDAQPGSLFQANGTLVTNIPSPCNDLCPPPPPYFADGRNWSNPALPETGTVVDVVKNAPEIPLDTERFDGTFLLGRDRDGTGWQVVARYVPANAVRVQVP